MQARPAPSATTSAGIPLDDFSSVVATSTKRCNYCPRVQLLKAVRGDVCVIQQMTAPSASPDVSARLRQNVPDRCTMRWFGNDS